MIQTDLYRSLFLALWCCIYTCIPLFGQSDALKKGNAAFEEDHFREALIYYNRIDKISTSAPILFKRGVCYYEINELDNALEDFRRAWEFGYTYPDIDLYTGKILHHKGQFAIAAKHYKDFLKEVDADDIRRQSVVKLIKQCGRAIDLSYLSPLAIIEHLPGGVNTAYDEIGLVESPSVPGKYYFTSNKPNLSSTLHASDYDVYWTQVEGGKWSDPKRMSYVLNRGDQDILLGFTPEADGIYFYRGKDFQGDILLSQGVNSKSKPRAVELPSTISLINNDAYFYNNEVVIFSSRDGQGYGGYDLYGSVKKDGYWTTPVNLGPQINSSFDEISPYLSEDGSEIYFSSDRDESIGGHDVFHSRYLYEADQWSAPSNMGIPINSPGDDTYFQLSYDGLTATLSSDRKNAYGDMDLYLIRFTERRISQGYGEGQLAFLGYKIPEITNRDLSTDGSFEKSVSTDTTSVNTLHKDDLPESNPPTQETASTKVTEGGQTEQINQEISIQPAQENVTLSPNVTSDNYGDVTEEVNSELPTEKPVVSLGYAPIYYSSGQDLVTQRNYDNLKRIVQTLKDHRNLQVELVGHSSSEGIVEYKLFSSLKIAERLQKYLSSEGIDESRVYIKGVGDNYPMVVQDESKPEIAKFTKYNSRVEIRFSDFNESSSSLERISPDIPAYAQDIKHDLYATILENSITYKISIAVVGQMFRNDALELFNDTSVEEDKTTGLYSYTIGLYDNFAEALKVQRDMSRLGITDAKVIAYYDGRRLSKEDYVYYVTDFPDLRGLMNYDN